MITENDSLICSLADLSLLLVVRRFPTFLLSRPLCGLHCGGTYLVLISAVEPSLRSSRLSMQPAGLFVWDSIPIKRKKRGQFGVKCLVSSGRCRICLAELGCSMPSQYGKIRVLRTWKVVAKRQFILAVSFAPCENEDSLVLLPNRQQPSVTPGEHT